MGYTPLFDSLTRGTLYGRWPDIGLWPILLSLADWRGQLDYTPEYISGVTGLELVDVLECLKRFCAPDSRSRSQEHGGARLVLLDPNRDWGWQIVNFTAYRERAIAANQVVSGANAEKCRRYRDRHRATPDDTRQHQATPHSDSDSDSDKSKRESPSASPKGKTATYLPDDFTLDDERRAYAVAQHIDPKAVDRVYEVFCDYWRAASGSRARKRNWDATWRNWCRTEGDRSRGANGSGSYRPRPSALERVRNAAAARGIDPDSI